MKVLKGPIRRFTRSAWFQRAVPFAIATLLRLIYATGRWRIVGLENPMAMWSQGQAVIGCFWHGRMLFVPHGRRWYGKSYMLISSHRDGLLISRTIRHLGVRTVSGSSNRRPAAAVRELTSLLRAGHTVAITPDGPRGPRMRAQSGVVKLAQLSGVPIVPVAGSAKRRRLLRSWDRFMVVWPFNSGVLMFGELIEVPRDADAAMLEAKRQAVENALNDLTAEADRRCGHDPVEPAPLPAGVEPASLDSRQGS